MPLSSATISRRIKKKCRGYHALSPENRVNMLKLTGPVILLIIDPFYTGEITDAWIFVGVLTYSQYAFVKHI